MYKTLNDFIGRIEQHKEQFNETVKEVVMTTEYYKKLYVDAYQYMGLKGDAVIKRVYGVKLSVNDEISTDIELLRIDSPPC